MRLRRRLHRQPRRDRQGPPRPTRPGRPRSARRPHAAQGCRARGAFVLSKTAAQDAPALRADELRPRRREGAVFLANPVSEWPFGSPWVRKGRTTKNRRPDRRTRRQVTASLPTFARHCAAILLPSHCFPAHFCPLLLGIARGGWGVPLSKCPRTVRRSRWALTTSAVHRSSRRPPGCFHCGERQNEPMLRKGERSRLH